MYLQTLSTSDFDTEKAEADSCQANRLLHSLFWFIKLSELSATIEARISSDNLGERDTRKWACSGLAYMAYNWESLLFTMPVMYFSIRSRCFSEIRGKRMQGRKYEMGV